MFYMLQLQRLMMLSRDFRRTMVLSRDWGDGDCYKWIEAAASVYAQTRDPELDRQMDELIAVITKAQAPDGYISTQIL